MTRAGTKSRLEAVVARSAAGALLKLSGIIDETLRASDFEGLRGDVVIDLAGVYRVTSYGVREWVGVLDSIPADSLWFTRCRPQLMSQLNAVTGFAGAGRLLSFFAPYLCSRCGSLHEELIDLREQLDSVRARIPPMVNCPRCGGPCEFDDLPEMYFEFAALQEWAPPPAHLAELLTGQLPFRAAKRVHGEVTLIDLSGALNGSVRLKRLADGLEGEVAIRLAGVSSVSDEGLGIFGAFLDEIRPPAQLLAAPLDVATGLQGRASAQLISVRLPFHCPRCAGRFEVELSHSDAEVVRECPGCSASTAGFDQGQLAALERLELKPATASALEAVRFAERRSPRRSTRSEAGERFGRYELVRPLGVGGMAEVHLARQTGEGNFEKLVVIKRILPQLGRNPKFVEMFLQEARLAAYVSHANVVQIFDLGRAGERYFIAMEYVRGWDLHAILEEASAQSSPMPVALAARIGIDICAGLQAAHSSVDSSGQRLDLVHRDVSPQNVLISCEGQVKITDFGIAKAADSATTPTHSIKGKLSYVAPEQLAGRGERVDARVDVFAAGLVLYQCLTFQNLFRRSSEVATLKAVLQDRIPLASDLRADVPAALSRILLRALARDPIDRYQSAQDLKAELERFLVGLGTPSTADDLAAWLKALTPLWVDGAPRPPPAFNTETSADLLEAPAEER